MSIETKLKSLRLSGIVNALPIRNQEAVQSKLSYMEFLEVLVEDELIRRQGRLMERRKQMARFPMHKTLDSFDFSFNPKINQRQIADLATGRFIPPAENIVLLGPPGVGKSHLAIAFGLSAIRCGYSTRYYTAYDLVDELNAVAQSPAERRQRLGEIARLSLLIIDDLGMKKLPASAGEDLLEIVMQRYEKAATIITSNRPMEDWGKMLGDNATAGVLLDRFLHHAHIIQITGRSYRMASRSVAKTEESK
jgi:DNA replication protein DnaC